MNREFIKRSYRYRDQQLIMNNQGEMKTMGDCSIRHQSGNMVLREMKCATPDEANETARNLDAQT